MTASCIIPAWNEQETIGAVVSVAAAHTLIDEVIVVDDGSTDQTAAVASAKGSTVIRNAHNLGKAQSMEQGVRSAKHDTILFLDADLRGLTADHITSLVQPVLGHQADMTVAIRDRGPILTQINALIGPWIAGERCLTRQLWAAVPAQYKKGFQIELALNHTARRLGLHALPVILPMLTIRKKEQKMGLYKGFLARLAMIRQLIVAIIKLSL